MRTSLSFWQRRKSYPSVAKSWTYRCISYTPMQKYTVIPSQLCGLRLLCCRSHLHVCTCIHEWLWCSLNRSYVDHCDVCTYCLELLWQKDCRITVWVLMWSPASGSPTATGPRWKLQAKFSSRYWSPAHHRFHLFCCQTSLGEGR